MNAFLAELGSKLADRWAAAVVVPGLLYLAAFTLAVRLGQGEALDLRRLGPWLTTLAADPASRSTGTVLLAAGAVLGASVAAALAAAALGRLMERLWLAPGRRQPARHLRQRRERRWREADDEVRAREQDAMDAAERAVAQRPQPGVLGPRLPLLSVPAITASGLAEAIARRDALSLVPPQRPTWIADRLRVPSVRVWRAYGLDLTVAWPRLWSIAASDLRADLTAAQDAYSTAARQAGWGALYLGLVYWWWPAALIAAGTLAAARSRGRAAAAVLADLIETTVDLHIRDLARRLEVGTADMAADEVGTALTRLLRKDDRQSRGAARD